MFFLVKRLVFVTLERKSKSASDSICWTWMHLPFLPSTTQKTMQTVVNINAAEQENGILVRSLWTFLCSPGGPNCLADYGLYQASKKKCQWGVDWIYPSITSRSVQWLQQVDNARSWLVDCIFPSSPHHGNENNQQTYHTTASIALQSRIIYAIYKNDIWCQNIPVSTISSYIYDLVPILNKLIVII